MHANRHGDIRPVPEQISALRNTSPHSVALSCGDRQLTYEELDRSADRFARYLRQLGSVPGGSVAICMERGRSTGSSPLSALCALVLRVCPWIPRDQIRVCALP